MKRNIEPVLEASEAVQERPEEKRAQGSAQTFEVKPAETVSIVAGNRVLFLGEGLKRIKVE